MLPLDLFSRLKPEIIPEWKFFNYFFMYVGISLLIGCTSKEKDGESLDASNLFYEMPEEIPRSEEVAHYNWEQANEDLGEAKFLKKQLEKGGGNITGTWVPVNNEDSGIYHFGENGYFFKLYDIDREGNLGIEDPGPYKAEGGLLWSAMEFYRDIPEGEDYRTIADGGKDTIVTIYAIENDSLWIGDMGFNNRYINYDIARRSLLQEEFFEDSVFVRVNSAPVLARVPQLH